LTLNLVTSQQYQLLTNQVKHLLDVMLSVMIPLNLITIKANNVPLSPFALKREGIDTTWAESTPNWCR